jgi:hypothetical protein
MYYILNFSSIKRSNFSPFSSKTVPFYYDEGTKSKANQKGKAAATDSGYAPLNKFYFFFFFVGKNYQNKIKYIDG